MRFLLLTLILISAVPPQAEASDKSQLTVGSLAPNFSVKEVDGESDELSAYRGKKVLLHFWAPSCFVCPQEVKALERLQARFGSELSQIVTVITFDNSKKSLQSASAMKLSLPALNDVESTVAKMYGVKMLPETFFIDEQGKLIEVADPEDPSKQAFRIHGPRDWGSQSAISALRKGGFIP